MKGPSLKPFCEDNVEPSSVKLDGGSFIGTLKLKLINQDCSIAGYFIDLSFSNTYAIFQFKPLVPLCVHGLHMLTESIHWNWLQAIFH